MPAFQFDHVHLRSRNPEKTALYYERMFGGTVNRSAPGGKPRVSVELGGMTILIQQVEEGAIEPSQPENPGLDHIGLCVSPIDAAVDELKAKGAVFTMEPKTIRPGVRIAFLIGPQGVPIELVDRNAAD